MQVLLVLWMCARAAGFVAVQQQQRIVGRASVCQYAEDEGVEKKKGFVRKFFSAAKKRIGSSSGSGEDGPAPTVPESTTEIEDEESNSMMYADLKKRMAAVEAEQESSVKDSQIYDALAAKTDFPRVAKRLKEVANVTESSVRLDDFEPSSGQSPGEVISGVLRALRDDGVKDDGTLEYGGVETMLKFTSSASSLASGEKNPVAIAQFFSNSEYSVLFDWDQIVFPTPLRLSMDGTKAYQTTKLRDSKKNEWIKVKWALSLRDKDMDKDGKWLIDTVIVTMIG